MSYYDEDDEMGKEMNYALEHHQFIMYMQPMFNLRTHEIIGAEALVRWNHPARGILSPFSFLPLFETNNFIIKLDHYIWDDAFKTIRHWIDNNVKPIPISINISPINLLKKLPVSIIKLDRKFLLDSVNNENGMTILRYLNAMTKELDKSVIAEGVETVEQANNLSEFGCDYAQGFFFSKPLPLREFDEFHKRISSRSYIPPVSYPTFKNAGNDMLP